MTIEQEYRVKLADVGKDKKITNKSLLGIFEDVACKHSDTIGYGVLNVETTNIAWLLLEWKVQIIRRPLYGEIVNARTWSRHAKKCYAYRDFELLDEKENIIAIAASKWVLINTRNGKIERVKEELLEKYNPEFERTVFENEDFEKISEPENYENEMSYKVMRLDIDVNNHMHNLNYIELANEVLPAEIYQNGQLNNIRITYKKEIKPTDTVKIKYSFSNNKNIICIKSDDDTIIHALIELM